MRNERVGRAETSGSLDLGGTCPEQPGVSLEGLRLSYTPTAQFHELKFFLASPFSDSLPPMMLYTPLQRDQDKTSI